MDRLVIRATREAHQREAAEEARRREEEAKRGQGKSKNRKRGRSRDRAAEAAAAASRGVLRISGAALRALCLAEAKEGCSAAAAERWATEAGTFGCVLLHNAPEVTVQGGLRVVQPADMTSVLFDVQTDLLARGRLVVLSSWDTLMQVAVPPRTGQPSRRLMTAAALYHHQQQHHQKQQQQQRQGTAPEGTSTAGLGSPGRSTATDEKGKTADVAGTPATRASTGGGRAEKQQPTDASSTMSHGSSATSTVVGKDRAGSRQWQASAHQRQEPVLDVVPAHTSSDDIKDLNELMEWGAIVVDASDAALATFLCCHCARLPAVSLTVSCCGALLCAQCMPAPPSRNGTTCEEQRCPVCQEEPLDPPRSHPHRDELLAGVVRQLKVLYLPQLRALHRRQSQGDPLPSPDSTSALRSPYMINSPSLGLL